MPRCALAVEGLRGVACASHPRFHALRARRRRPVGTDVHRVQFDRLGRGHWGQMDTAFVGKFEMGKVAEFFMLLLASRNGVSDILR